MGGEPLARGAPRDPWVGAWLLLVCALVVLMILIGGATRLTDSGLSITEWRPVTGAIPPLSDADWAAEFAKYRQTTEYALQNKGMSLAEFQLIYWWEWGHRFLGRIIGVVFAVPFFVFWVLGRLRGRFWACLGLFALGGVQGAVGWWMVASGLTGRLDVSPIRLATHLGLAFIILALAWRLALGAFAWPGKAGRLGAPRWWGWLFVLALFAQIIAGALVAGSDAGPAYADWPRIGGEWIPSSYAALKPYWRNWVENHATLQFNHRTLGYALAALAFCTAFVGAFLGKGPPRVMASMVLLLTLIQAGLGIATVVHGSPLHWSLIHQGGAIALWLAAHAMMRAAAWR